MSNRWSVHPELPRKPLFTLIRHNAMSGREATSVARVAVFRPCEGRRFPRFIRASAKSAMGNRVRSRLQGIDRGGIAPPGALMLKPFWPSSGKMSLSEQNLNAVSGGARDFRTTQWSLVLKAGRGGDQEAAAALEKLCRAYWYPLYAFVRRRGYDPETARDLTQSFFAALLARNQFAVADPTRGRFRSFLVHSLTHFLANEWRDSQRLKRGGGTVAFSLDGLEPEERYRLEPAAESDAEKLFERRWAYTLVERALQRLQKEHERAGKSRVFVELAAFLPGGAANGTKAEVAQRLGMSEGAVKVAVHRLRQRFRTTARACQIHFVSTPMTKTGSEKTP